MSASQNILQRMPRLGIAQSSAFMSRSKRPWAECSPSYVGVGRGCRVVWLTVGLRTCLLALLVFSALFLTVAAAAPAAPSNLRGIVKTSTSFEIVLDDNSTDEDNFVMVYSYNGSAAQTLSLDPSVGTGTTGYLFNTPVSWSTATIQFVAIKGSESSSLSNAVSLTFSTPFNPPNSPLLQAQSDGRVLVMWTDNSSAESGYLVEIATALAGPYSVFGATSFDSTGLFCLGLVPGTTYFFRVKAFQGPAASPTTTSTPTTVVSVTTPLLAAPTGLTASALAPYETSVTLAYNDNTVGNTGYEIESTLSGGSFAFLGEVTDGSGETGPSSVNVPDFFEPGTTYDLRVRAYFLNSSTGVRSYSGYSNIVTYTTPLLAPTMPVATATSETTVTLSWIDNSAVEGGYAIYGRQSGSGNYVLLDYAAPNATSYGVTGLVPGTAYEFQVAAAYQTTAPRTNIIESDRISMSATMKDGFTSPAFVTFGANNAYVYTATTSTSSARISLAASTLPNGMFFNSSTGEITGTPSQYGLFTVTLSATFANGWIATHPVAMRIVRPPAAPTIAATLPATQTLTAGAAATTISLDGKFADDDTESAVRLNTTKGVLDVLLYPAETPLTVANFMGYVNRGDYNDSAFHRISSIADSGVVVLQGGQLKTSNTGPTQFTEIQAQPVVQNEPGVSNLNWTIAMARSSAVNSATKEFYFNLTDSNAVLDTNNVGFTVFGRVSNATQATLLALTSTPIGGPYQYLVDNVAVSSPFKWPLDVVAPEDVPAVMDNTKVLKILSATPIPTLLNYSVHSSAPGVVGASVSNSDLILTPLSGGVSTITVTATDLDGGTASQTFTVTVTDTYATWKSRNTFSGGQDAPAQDPDADGWTNLQEYAFLGDPSLSNNTGLQVFRGVDGVAPAARYLTLTFPLRKATTGLSYMVEANDGLSGMWSEIWKSADGFSHAQVLSALDESDRTVLTIKDVVALGAQPKRFLRIKLVQE